MIAEEVHVEEIAIDEIDNPSVEEMAVVVQNAVEYAVDKVADCAAKDHRQGNAESKVFISCLVEIQGDTDARDDRKN